VLNTVAGVGKVSMDVVTRGVMPFMLAQFAVMFFDGAVPAAGDGAGPLVLLKQFFPCRVCFVRHVLQPFNSRTLKHFQETT
jgi:hypothetical protein